MLLELAQDHEAVQARLARMQLADRPDKLAAGFKKTLSGWRRSNRFYGYREAAEFGRMLDGWLDQVARELLPKDPTAGLALFESFIEADAAWFDRADDSDGVIGDAVRAACRHWLQAAARCETPRDVWPERLPKLYQADHATSCCRVPICCSKSHRRFAEDAALTPADQQPTYGFVGSLQSESPRLPMAALPRSG